jgi:hypothetical protein
VCRAGDAAVQTGERHGAGATGQPDPIADLSDGPNCGKFLLVLGHEEHAIFLTGVNRKGERHAREDDYVV